MANSLDELGNILQELKINLKNDVIQSNAKLYASSFNYGELQNVIDKYIINFNIIQNLYTSEIISKIYQKTSELLRYTNDEYMILSITKFINCANFLIEISKSTTDLNIVNSTATIKQENKIFNILYLYSQPLTYGMNAFHGNEFFKALKQKFNVNAFVCVSMQIDITNEEILHIESLVNKYQVVIIEGELTKIPQNIMREFLDSGGIAIFLDECQLSNEGEFKAHNEILHNLQFPALRHVTFDGDFPDRNFAHSIPHFMPIRAFDEQNQLDGGRTFAIKIDDDYFDGHDARLKPIFANIEKIVTSASEQITTLGKSFSILHGNKTTRMLISDSFWDGDIYHTNCAYQDYGNGVRCLVTGSIWYDTLIKKYTPNDNVQFLVNLVSFFIDMQLDKHHIKPLKIFSNLTLDNKPQITHKEIKMQNKVGNKVFIVHGHDTAVKHEVARFIGSVGLEVIILHEQANSGKTIIEKIEAYTDVGFGIVLYTPCDFGGVATNTTEHKPRARQNVVFEHGYLMAKLGRERVCALVKYQTETPSDIDGVIYTLFDKDGAWKIKLANELKNSGYDIDLNKILT